MNNVFELKAYRNRRKKDLWRKHGHRIERFVRQFVRSELMVNIHDLIDEYQYSRSQENADVWAYEDFRMGMLEAILVRHGAELDRQLRAHSWFDPSLITREEVAELFLTSMVLGEPVSLARKYR